MQQVSAVRWSICLALAVGIPGIGCFGYYSAGDGSAALAYLVALAYPVALIGLATFLIPALASRRSNWVSKTVGKRPR